MPKGAASRRCGRWRSGCASFASADRVFKRCRRGSGRYRVQQRRIARLHAKVADARANFLHQVSRRIVDENQALVTETLNVRGMMRNRCNARGG